MRSKRLTIADVKRLAVKLGGRVQPDGCGGYEVLAPPHCRWIDAEVQCYPLPLNECQDAQEKQDEIQTCLNLIGGGHERFPGE
jgi:hypothetical protein